MPFFLHNVIGIDTGHGFKLRVPLALSTDGSIAFASNVPAGSIVRIMEASSTSTSDAALTAVTSALNQLNGWKPKVALFFDCVATRLRLGKDFGYELDTAKRALGEAQLVGCNTYGQIVRADGQFSGFHNGTAVVFEETGVHRASDYLPQLHKEHSFWMSGGDVRCVSGPIPSCHWKMPLVP